MRFAARHDLGPQQHALFAIEFAGQDPIDRLVTFVGRDVRQEAQSAAVDSEQGDAGHCRPARGM